MRDSKIKTILVVLSAAAVALAILTIFVVFSPTGAYQTVNIPGISDSSTTITGAASSTATSTATNATSTASSTSITSGTGGTQFSSEYTYPYPVTWNEGREIFAVTAAEIQNGQITLNLAIQMGNVSECVPVNIALVADENGTLQPPSNVSSTFTFPDTQSCKGTPGATYSESLVFTAGPATTAPYLFTTGGAANTFFNLATSSAGGVDIALPGNSG